MAENTLPKRKHIRLKTYDYSTPGAYFVTICTHNRRCLLSRVVGRGLLPPLDCHFTRPVEDAGPYNGCSAVSTPQDLTTARVGTGLRTVRGTPELFCGRFASPRPTLTDIVCAYKSLTTRECKKLVLTQKLFQNSFYDHVIRDEKDFEDKYNYILANPSRWHDDELYCEE